MSAPTAMPASYEAAAGGDGAAAGGPGPVLLHHDPINILIVDDEPKNLTVLETVLDDPGYRLVRAESADQALLALVSKEFALLILDVRMPIMTGFELAQLIRQRKKNEQVPIIFLTAYYNEDEHVLEGYGTGAVDYLQKPVNPIILRSKVSVFADLHRKSRALEVANRALVAEVTERRDAQAKLRELNETLEKRVADRTEELLERTRLEVAHREQLQASEAFNRSLIEGTTDAVQVLDLQGRILHLNGPALVQLGINAVEIAREQDWTARWPEVSRALLKGALAKARTGGAAAFTILRPTALAEDKWWNVSVSAVRNSENGQVVRVLVVSRDVTESREVEQALRRSDEQKDLFIATLAHELRNPLAPIKNAVALLRKLDPADPQLVRCTDLIDRQVAQMTRLLEDLLDVSRITRSKLTLRRDVLDLATVIEQAVEIARPSLLKEGHVFETVLPSKPVFVHGDLTRLAQVISNLLINSAKFTSAGGQIRLSGHRESQDVLVSVNDNGIGIAPENLGQIFEMFSQVSDGKQHHQGGLGIGLSLARGLVEMHGGRLTARSAGLGQGSEFIVRLPACEAPVLDQMPRGSTPVEADAGARCRILVVDDLKDNADSLASLLESMGHVVEVRYDGGRAIQAAEEFGPDIAFIDLGMPQVDGFEVCRQIRSRPWGTKMYLVAQTGWGQEFDRRRTQAAGFDLHMVKPLELEALGPLLHRIGMRANSP